MLALYIITGILAVLVILSLIPINAIFAVSFEDKLEGIEFLIRFMFIRIRILPSKPKADEAEKEEKQEQEKDEKKEERKPSGSKIEKVRKIYRLAIELLPDVERVLARLIAKVFTIHDLDISARIGTEDAMFTGLAVGAADGFIYPLLGIIDHNMKLRRFNVSIAPDWSGKELSASFYTRISTTVASVLRLAVMLIPIYFKFRRLNKVL